MKHYAEYYKCALQVNPASYASNRGKEVLDEKEYNRLILEKCIINNIKIIGLADHGNIDSSKTLRDTLRKGGITVFPGFEIASAEKIHLVCLFPEEKTESELNKYLGALGLDSAEKGTESSKLSCEEILKKVEENGGFAYAAHITNSNGILHIGKMNNVWKSEYLMAAQIPGKKEELDPKFKNIIENTNPDYKRKKEIAIINASDIVCPDDLDNVSATTLIKMTEPTFSNFKMAFHDSDSRIRLNSETEDTYQSCIESIRVVGGYLDGLNITLSPHLDAVIGGRGTGKSTILNLIRYALEIEPKNRDRKKEFESMIDHNLCEGGRIEMWITSYVQHGKRYRIIKRYKQDVIIEDDTGEPLQLTIKDILPTVDFYGQNEIVESAEDKSIITKMVIKMLEEDSLLKEAVNDAYNKLHQNSQSLISLINERENDENEVASLPALEERMKYYKEAGIEEKLPRLTEITNEESIVEQFESQIESFNEIQWPSISLEVDNEISKKLSVIAESFNNQIKKVQKDYNNIIEQVRTDFKSQKDAWKKQNQLYDDEIRVSLSELEGIQDKSGNEIASEFTKLLQAINKAQPVKKKIDDREKKIKNLREKRVILIESCRKALDAYRNDIKKKIKTLNKKKLKDTIRVSINYGADKSELLNILNNISGLGSTKLSGIENQSNLDVIQFAEDIRNDYGGLANKYSISQGTSDKIKQHFNEIKLLNLEEVRFSDVVNIELLVNGKYKQLDRLSKGQQCTVILHLLLLDNKDPLIIDQPEDNLDNAFISDSLISSLRENKTKRQYLFATHNANIPVFGDAELIIAMEEIDNHGQVSEGGIGSIDDQNVKEKVINILEGGKEAFRMRKEKYDI